MSYESEISRANPTCFFFLIDQSSSMYDPIMGVQGNPRKADFIAEALNKVIQTLIVTASKDEGIRRYYQIGALGYGNVICSPFEDLFGEQELIWVDELAEKPLRVEDRIKKESDGAGGVIQVQTKFPVWIEPVASGRTPMCEVLARTKVILEKWVNDHPYSYPPTVINLTDGEANDGDPRIQAEELKELKTKDGNLLLFTLHASSNQFFNPIGCPSVDEVLPDNASKLMFEMSSRMLVRMVQMAKNEYGFQAEDGAKAFVYNADIDQLVALLEIGTRPANMR
jgi:hypothetical protein